MRIVDTIKKFKEAKKIAHMQQEWFPYSVGIIGTGRNLLSVGWKVAEELCRSSRAEQIFLANRTKEHAGALKEYLHLMMSQQPAPQEREITACSVEEIVEAEPDVTLIALDATARAYGASWRERVNEGGAKRENFLAANLPEIVDCARAFRPAAQRYSGAVLVATNPVDVLTYVFLRESGLDAAHVAGFNEGDRERFRRVLLEEFREGQPLLEMADIEAWVLGSHDGYVVPVFSQAVIASSTWNECVKRKGSLSRGALHELLIKEADRWMGLLGTTSPELAACMARTIEAIGHGSAYQPTLSLRTIYREEPLCIGQRADVRNGMRPVPMELDSGEQEQYECAQERLLYRLDTV